MDIKEILIKLSDINKEDKVLTVLDVMSLVADENLEAVVDGYKKMLKGEIVVADVYTRVKLDADQKSELEKKINAQYKNVEVLYNYKVKSDLADSLRVEIGDKVYRYSI